MTWTNVRIEDRFSYERTLQSDNAFLNFQLKLKSSEIDSLYKELENIFCSLYDYL